ncbi:hypothetical protein BDR04DRAFT_1097490 [Suillus decipiens]|nr:hypothetical protein BDR04DRAFT_1097490 [Suillus decipiens]
MSPDGSMVISGSKNDKLRLWNIRKGSVVGDTWEGYGGLGDRKWIARWHNTMLES